MAGRKKQSQTVDLILLVTLVALLAYGLLMLYSATFYVGESFWQKQLVWVALGGGILLAMYRLPYTLWQKLALPMMVATLILLFLVLLLGELILGAQRSLLGASIQPGVLARLIAVIYIAAWLASKGEQLNRVRYGLIPFAIIIGVVAGMVALQPDLSTALLLAVTGLAMFFYAGGDPIQIFLSVVSGGSAFGFLAWQLPHARARLVAYMASLRDPMKMPYHVQRAITAIGEGGILGVGIGSGRLKSGYLPFPHTDSIFAVIGEEAGLLGALLVIALFILLAYRGYRVALETPEPFGSLLAFGATTMLITEALLNIMVMVGLIPFTGTALPFFSYGGSEMLVTMAAAGLLLGISRGRPKGEMNAILDRWRWDGGPRVSGARRSPGLASRRA
ncbi:MAG TPA: FtsW/RodA/SpoVE family cell cycle protein [Anaerolineae bacterium]|nr:FtsW/RodA/SpoVE family cell cycle protein [Anaerolineae bacterium]HQI86056.1 FtsW/RodA/SpoVE family cell cycle protein [Anaerolineae bacterium]